MRPCRCHCWRIIPTFSSIIFGMESEPVTSKCTDFETAVVLHLGLASFAPPKARCGLRPLAQTSSLLYRGFPIRPRFEVAAQCRLAAAAPKRRFAAPRRRKVGATAGWKPALLAPYEIRVRCRLLERSI